MWFVGDFRASVAYGMLGYGLGLVVGVEPTNNAAERAIRPAVIWRRTSFGSQTQAGSTFVGRMLTVVTTLKSQHRTVLEFIASSVKAAREG